jgi:nitrilase
MTQEHDVFTVAAVQATPVFLDRETTIEKACRLIGEAAGHDARLVVFPESFVPGYPDWVWAIPPGEADIQQELYAEFVANSVMVPGPAVERLCQAARENEVHVVMGVSEQAVDGSRGSLYNTLLYIGPDGRLLGKHRKLVPTGGERLVWAQGDGSTLQVYETGVGRLGGLICWENYMPLARYTMYASGIQVYIAATWDRGEPWLSTVRHIAKEGAVYVISACIAMRQADIPDHYAFKQRYYAQSGEWINSGDSVIIGPDGMILAGPLQEQEGILYAQIEHSRMLGSKWKLDVAGHYARPDVFELIVHSAEHPLLRRNDVSENSQV